jgi:hypothetical protein
MGIAKSIEAYTVSPLYSRNTENFINKLSELLDANFIINEYDTEYEAIGQVNRKTSFNKLNQYRLIIEHNDYTINNKSVTLPDYELTVPIKHTNEKELQFIFLPNKIVQIIFLTFEHNWMGFVETLKFNLYPEDRPESIYGYESLRKEYKSILNKLDIPSIFIIPDAHYKIFEIQNIESYTNLEFSDIQEIALRLDKLEPFNLEKILYSKSRKELPSGFINHEALNIAFIDNLKNESELSIN